MTPERRCELLGQAFEHLAMLYKPEGVRIWLTGRHRQLGGCSPLEVLLAGEVEAFLAVVPDPGMVAT